MFGISRKDGGKILLYVVLAIGSLFGTPVRAEEIEALMADENKSKVVQQVTADD